MPINPLMIKIAIGGAILFLLCYLSYDYGKTSVTAKWNAERAELNANTAKALTKLNKDNQALQDALMMSEISTEHIKEVIQIETKEVEKEVIKYVETTVNNCELDANWLRIYNQSINRTKAATSAGVYRGMRTAYKARVSQR